jgi:hypothetical protein
VRISGYAHPPRPRELHEGSEREERRRKKREGEKEGGKKRHAGFA